MTNHRILHVCLASSYMTGYMYQENLLPLYHKHNKAKVLVIANCTDYDQGRVIEKPPGTYEDRGIVILRIKRLFQSVKILSHLRIYKNVFDDICDFRPSIIFMHDAQFWNTQQIRRYLRKFPNTMLFIDCHTDEGNSASNALSKWVLHKFYFNWRISLLRKHVHHWWAILPRRKDFLMKYYSIEEKDISYLPLGYDDLHLIEDIHECSPINEDYIIIVGRFDPRKNILDFLKEWFNECNIRVVLVGPVLQSGLDTYIHESSLVTHYEWAVGSNLNELIANSLGAVFPGTHSTLWEWSLGLGVRVFVKEKCYTGLDKTKWNLFEFDETSQNFAQFVLLNLNAKLKHSSEDYFFYSRISQIAITKINKYV